MFSDSQPRDAHGMWTSDGANAESSKAAEASNAAGRASGKTSDSTRAAADASTSNTIHDKNGKEYVVDHETRVDADGNTRHMFNVYKAGADMEAARRGNATDKVASAELDRKSEAVMAVYTYPEYQRQGIGTALYEHMDKAMGKPLKPNAYQTDEGRALWAARTGSHGKAAKAHQAAAAAHDSARVAQMEVANHSSGRTQVEATARVLHHTQQVAAHSSMADHHSLRSGAIV